MVPGVNGGRFIKTTLPSLFLVSENLAVFEEAFDFRSGGFRGVGGMADVAHFRVTGFVAEVAADRAGGGGGGIGGSEEVANTGNDVISFEGKGDHRCFLHETPHGREKRHGGDMGVVLGEDFIAEGHHFDPADHKSFFRKAGQNLTGEVFGDRVRFEKNQRSFVSHALEVGREMRLCKPFSRRVGMSLSNNNQRSGASNYPICGDACVESHKRHFLFRSQSEEIEISDLAWTDIFQ